MLAAPKKSIASRLARINVLVSATALLMACAAFVGYDAVTFGERLVYNVSIQAQIVASNSVSAIVFDDPASATNTLAALQAAPNIKYAAVLTPDEKPFAEYQPHPGHTVTAWPRIAPGTVEAHQFGTEGLTMTRLIIFDGKPIGTVIIQTGLQRLWERLGSYAALAGAVWLASLAAAFFASSIFGRALSKPIAELASTAQGVSRDRDYSVRARKTEGADELNSLVQSFNEMLSQIQARDVALQQGREELEQRVQERTAQLSAANRELESFSYSVSHDLRAPLRSIDGFSQALAEDCTDKLDELGKDHLKRIRAAAQRMAELIDDMLNLSRVSRAECVREDLDLSGIAQSVTAELRKAEPDRKVQFMVAPQLEDSADPRLLRVVLDNLLGNAWKFTARKEQARVEFGVDQRNGMRVYFVRDNGAGFNMEYAARLFGAFQRLHTVREFPGTGVGLATVQRIIHRHGGRVWAESEVDKGATFYFTLQDGSPIQGGVNDG